MIKYQDTIEINQPAKAVFDFVSDLSQMPLWQSGLTDVDCPKEIEVGSTIKATSHNLGQKLDTEVEITRYEPPEVLAFRSFAGPIQFDISLGIEASDSHTTRFIWDCQIETGGFYRLAEPVLEQIGKTKTKADLKSLKTILESPTPTDTKADPNTARLS